MPRITPVDYKRLVKLFEVIGFKYSRTKGDYVIFVKQGTLRPLVIPKYSQIPVFVIKNLLRTAQIGRDEYFELLHKC